VTEPTELEEEIACLQAFIDGDFDFPEDEWRTIRDCISKMREFEDAEGRPYDSGCYSLDELLEQLRDLESARDEEMAYAEPWAQKVEIRVDSLKLAELGRSAGAHDGPDYSRCLVDNARHECTNYDELWRVEIRQTFQWTDARDEAHSALRLRVNEVVKTALKSIGLDETYSP
jgi:hypothetical protein